MSLQGAEHSSVGVVPSEMWLIVNSKPHLRGDLGPSGPVVTKVNNIWEENETLIFPQTDIYEIMKNDC